MKKIFGILFILLFVPIAVQADNFCIEEENLLQMAQTVETLILKAEHGEWKGCKFEGKYVDLDGDDSKNDLIVTTADGCGSGNAKGPIWVLRGKKNGEFKLLLSWSGYRLTVNKLKKNGLYGLDIMAETAGWHEEDHFKFNGKKYYKVVKPSSKRR